MTVSGVIVLALVGLAVGSFLNVCITRLPDGESVVTPASRCPDCRTPIAWRDNIPVVSYLALRARCRACGGRISPRYPLVEIATALAFVAQTLTFGSDPVWLVTRLVLTSALIVLFATDLETHRLPNVITLPGIVVGLAFSAIRPPGFVEAFLGVLLGGGILLVVRWGWKAATGVDGMGLGDVKMLAMVGAFLGWKQVWLVLFVSSLLGAVVGVALAASGTRSLESRLPFGTFLAASAFAASLIGDSIVSWYASLY